MTMLIKEILNPATIHTLSSNSDPSMIRQENVAMAAKELVKAIKLLDLYPNHQSLIDRFEPLREKYPAIHAHRTNYVWRASQAFYQLTSLNLPEADFLQSNALKCQASFVNVLLDDICDLGRDKTIFDRCVLALKGQIVSEETELYTLIAETWADIQRAIELAPNYVLLKPMLEEAYQLWIACFEYSLSIQQESFRFEQTWKKHLELISYSSYLYSAGLIDLLFVPNLSARQASSAAKVFLYTQEMAQIANWAITWERELKQQDFTGGVFSVALENHWIEWDDLEHGSLETVREKIQSSPAENYLWNEWEQLRVTSHQIVKETQLPALEGYVESLSIIMFMIVASKGLI